MSVFKRKTSSGETKEYHYRFIQSGKLFHGVCEGCTTERQALEYEKRKKEIAKDMAARKSDIEDFDKYREQVITGETQIMLADAFDEYMKKPRDREPAAKRLKLNQAHFADFVAFMAKNYPDITSLRAVSAKHAEEYIHLLKTTGAFSKEISYTAKSKRRKTPKSYISKATQLSAATVNARHKQLKSVFHRLKKDIGIVHNPFEFSFMESNKESRQVFSEPELKLIWENMTMPFTKPIFTIGLCTGLSLSDICLFKWSEVNLKAGVIENKYRRKTKVLLEIPILPPLMDFLQEQNLIMNGEYVCPELAQMYLDNPTGINHRVKSFLEGLDIQTTATVNNRSRAVSTKAAHALRHTFAYMAGVYNIPLAIVQSILGHMSPEMTEMYQRHASLKDKQKYLAQLPIALIGAAKAEPERQQLAELSKTLPIETIKNILKTLEV